MKKEYKVVIKNDRGYKCYLAYAPVMNSHFITNSLAVAHTFENKGDCIKGYKDFLSLRAQNWRVDKFNLDNVIILQKKVG